MIGHFRRAPVCKGEASTTGEKGKVKKKTKVEKPVRRLKDEDSSTDTSEAEHLGRIVESVASETARSETQSQSGDVKVLVSVRTQAGWRKDRSMVDS